MAFRYSGLELSQNATISWILVSGTTEIILSVLVLWTATQKNLSSFSQYPRDSPGDRPLTKKPEDSGNKFENAHCLGTLFWADLRDVSSGNEIGACTHSVQWSNSYPRDPPLTREPANSGNEFTAVKRKNYVAFRFLEPVQTFTSVKFVWKHRQNFLHDSYFILNTFLT